MTLELWTFKNHNIDLDRVETFDAENAIAF